MKETEHQKTVNTILVCTIIMVIFIGMLSLVHLHGIKGRFDRTDAKIDSLTKVVKYYEQHRIK